MPKSLRCKIKKLCYNGTLTERERDRILKALEQEPREEDIHREREQAYMLGYEDASKKFRTEPSEDCISRQAVIILIDEASEMHPYKVVGDSDTYSNYNQGWSDACDWLYANIEGVPSATPQTVTEFADKCKECGKIQNEFFNFDAPMVKKSDAVSREAVIRLVEQYPNIIGNRCSGLIADIKHLPSVTPQRPKGKWIEDTQTGFKIRCSECGARNFGANRNYCPNCGSDNGGGEDG